MIFEFFFDDLVSVNDYYPKTFFLSIKCSVKEEKYMLQLLKLGFLTFRNLVDQFVVSQVDILEDVHLFKNTVKSNIVATI